MQQKKNNASTKTIIFVLNYNFQSNLTRKICIVIYFCVGVIFILRIHKYTKLSLRELEIAREREREREVGTLFLHARKLNFLYFI